VSFPSTSPSGFTCAPDGKSAPVPGHASRAFGWASRAAVAAAAAFAVVFAANPARADDTVRHPGDHPAYTFEAEPHLLFGWDNVYAADGFGIGGRFAIPIVDNGFVPQINNSVAIGFGLDLIHYDSCWWGGDCSANYIHVPVVLQWNFYVAKRWSVFGEPGLVFFHGFIDDCPSSDKNCPNRPRETSLEPALYLGGRYYFDDKITLTMRIGFPSISIGVSFFP
jgi:hypothetical protein